MVRRVSRGLEFGEWAAGVPGHRADHLPEFGCGNVGRAGRCDEDSSGPKAIDPLPSEVSVCLNGSVPFVFPFGQRWRIKDDQVEPAFRILEHPFESVSLD